MGIGEHFRQYERMLGRSALYFRKHGIQGVAPALQQSVLHRMGRSPRPPRFVDLSTRTADPFVALNESSRDTPIIRVSFDRLRPYALSVSFSDMDRNPFVRTVQEVAAGGTDSYPGSALHTFYAQWQPETLGDLYGIQAGESEYLKGAPAPDSLPWMDGAWPDDIAAGRQIHERRMKERLGVGVDRHGFRSFGPVSQAAGEQFYRDYADLTRSVMDSGYLAHLGEQPTMELLTDGSRWAGRLLAGNHRCAVLAGLGHEAFEVAVCRKVVSRGDAGRWPGVRSGLYTRDEAIAVFERFLMASPLPGYPDLSAGAQII